MGWVVSFKMKAMVMTGFGSPDVFELREIPKPQIKAGHVIIRVRASSVNPIDYKIRSGLLKNLAPENGVLGFDVSGIAVLLHASFVPITACVSPWPRSSRSSSS